MAIRLILLRHAEAAEASSDHTRPLTEMGTREATRIGRRIAEHGWTPERCLASDAVRALATAERAAEALGLGDCEPVAALYGGSVARVTELLASLPSELGTVLLVGHNPTFSEAASHLSGCAIALAPATAALLEHEGASWAEACRDGGGWTLVALLVPG